MGNPSESVKPLLSYYGGKQRLASKILQHFPPHTVYVEPFAGGAALLFAKPRTPVTNKDHYREVLNDTNDLLITFYRAAIEQQEALLLKIQATLYSQSDYALSVTIVKNRNEYDDLTVAWAVYVNLGMSFSNILNGRWRTGVFSHNHASTWCNAKDRLLSSLNRIKDCHISAEDALACIRRWDSPHTLFYCDPPYPGAKQGHYGGYTKSDFDSLIETLKSVQGSFVLSNYDQDSDFCDTWQTVDIVAHSSASGAGQVGLNRDKSRAATQEELGRRSRIEKLWIKERTLPVRDSLAPHMNKFRDAPGFPECVPNDGGEDWDFLR